MNVIEGIDFNVFNTTQVNENKMPCQIYLEASLSNTFSFYSYTINTSMFSKRKKNQFIGGNELVVVNRIKAFDPSSHISIYMDSKIKRNKRYDKKHCKILKGISGLEKSIQT